MQNFAKSFVNLTDCLFSSSKKWLFMLKIATNFLSHSHSH
ncbi:hypothetical protein HMPREF0027_0591 [Actinobacillus ureae ATCC 25976]|uniref:Uncharacterized protein n=1 Tax=Actinobacillus ureae ATCC 25976 TaxID=887324 RepID=E8KFH4_9PAST|nr:hypothetical protein HMPREF0027_0591 [Actinobacillus ureae ATCC 25976]